jgi:hypothetical protein
LLNASVIFDDELNWSAEHAARFVHLFSSELCALNLVKAGFVNCGPQ